MKNIFDILIEQVLNEGMAPIYREENYKIAVFYEPLGNPSFHVFYRNDWHLSISIKDFSILEVKSGDFKKGNQLPTKIKKDIINILNKDMDEDITVWKYLILTWNVVNLKYTISTKTQIP